MTWWDIRGKQLWHGIEGNFCSAGQRQSLKTIKAALSQLHKFSSCSRWTLFVSWFILPECIRNTAQLSRSHLMHPSEMFSITERSWEKNCWLQQGLTFKKEKKKKKKRRSVLDWCFHHIFAVPENNSSSLQYKELQNSLINTVSVWQRGNKKWSKNWENLVYSSQTAKLLTGASYMPGLGYHFPTE